MKVVQRVNPAMRNSDIHSHGITTRCIIYINFAAMAGCILASLGCAIATAAFGEKVGVVFWQMMCALVSLHVFITHVLAHIILSRFIVTIEDITSKVEDIKAAGSSTQKAATELSDLVGRFKRTQKIIAFSYPNVLLFVCFALMLPVFVYMLILMIFSTTSSVLAIWYLQTPMGVRQKTVNAILCRNGANKSNEISAPCCSKKQSTEHRVSAVVVTSST
jgi:hypothetical protein